MKHQKPSASAQSRSVHSAGAKPIRKMSLAEQTVLAQGFQGAAIIFQACLMKQLGFKKEVVVNQLGANIINLHSKLMGMRINKKGRKRKHYWPPINKKGQAVITDKKGRKFYANPILNRMRK
jgi:hypothetical protein